MAKRPRNRLELREQYEAAEAREREALREAGEDFDEEEDDEDVSDLDLGDSDVEDDEEALIKPKKKAKKAPAKPRKKTAKVVRKRVVWVVFDNSNKKIAQFDYIKKDEALALAEKLKTEKKQTYFVQPFKEEMTE